MNTAAFFGLVRKDLMIFFSDRRAVAILFIGPILIAAFFGSLFGGGGKKPTGVPVAIVDLDNSVLTRAVVAGLRADSTLALQTLLQAEAIELVRKGKLRAAIVLPAGFGDAATRSMFRPGVAEAAGKPVITVHHDPSQSMVLPMVNGVLMQHVMRATVEATISNSTFLNKTRGEVEASSLPEVARGELATMFDSIARVQSRAQGAQGTAGAAAENIPGKAPGRSFFDAPFTMQSEAVTSGPGRDYNGYAQSFAGMSVQFVLFMGIDLGIALLTVRRSGIWKRLRAAPVGRGVLLGANLASTSTIAAIAMAVIFTAALLFFGVQINGSVPGFIGIALCFCLFTASYGLLIATVANSPEGARGLSVLVTMLLVMLGGAWIPSFVFPEWLQTVTLILPTTWAIDGLAGMTWRGLDFFSALNTMGVLLAFTAAFIAVAVSRFKWEE